MKIALIHRGNAYKPEALIYKAFFEKNGAQLDILKEIDEQQLSNYDIEWHFAGFDRLSKKTSRIKIHEYTSLSVPPLPKIKNLIKKKFNVKPDLRIFQTESVRRHFNFTDDIPYLFRGPGISESFFKPPITSIHKSYDFVYLGTMEAVRSIDYFLGKIIKLCPKCRILMIGKAPEKLLNKYNLPTIDFIGPVSHEQVPIYLQKATYGLNLMPDKYPFNIQPSLKLLEYCATDLKVITTDYKWVREFEQKHQAKFFKLNADLSNLEYSQLEQFNFINPHLEDFRWEKVIKRAEILPKIEELYTKLTKGLS